MSQQKNKNNSINLKKDGNKPVNIAIDKPEILEFFIKKSKELSNAK